MSANEKMCSFVQLEEGSGSALVAALCTCRRPGAHILPLLTWERWPKKDSVLPCQIVRLVGEPEVGAEPKGPEMM
jgi:hypothetical protein